jgi:probable F420-dependent oxidoreductase
VGHAGLEIGLTMFATDRSVDIVTLARDAESRGFTSLYVPEHTHIPTSRVTPPPTGDAELAEEYRRTLDPFVALAAAAAVTSRIKLGTGICLVAQRDPIVLAKEVATLDLLSGGRFVFGIGFGWNAEEMASHGISLPDRRDVVREKLLAMRALWTRERAAYVGKWVKLDECWSWPKPVQAPHPPVLLGGAAGPKLFAHVAEYCDGWMPIGGAGIAAALPALRAALDARGRDPGSVRIVPFGTVPSPGKLDYYASIGVREVVLRIPSAARDEVLTVLDAYAPYL